MPKSRATVRAHASFLRFACVKHASTHMYLHTCVKFKLSCTVASIITKFLFIYSVSEKLGSVEFGTVHLGL